jgi:hypothetical protein
MPTFRFPESASIVTRTVTGQDSDGNDVYTPVETATSGAFAPAGSTELIQGRNLVIEDDTFYLSDGAPVPRATDQLRVRGVLYAIKGSPEKYHNPHTGTEPGAELRLERVTG